MVGYYLAPLDRPLDSGALLALAVVGAVVAWQVRTMLASDVARLRAIQTVAVGLPMMLLVFASVYVQIETNRPNSFTEVLSRTDALYFTRHRLRHRRLRRHRPKSELARIITMTQMIMGLVALGLVAKIVVGAVQTAVARREGAAAVGPTAPAPQATLQPDASADGGGPAEGG
jgi:voltage-gated potassium channel